MENYRYRINEIELNNQQKITTKKINIFIGANNCGKTQMLKDIISYITGDKAQKILVKNINDELPETFEQFNTSYELNIIQENNSNKIRHISPTFNENNTEYYLPRGIETLNSHLKNDKRVFMSAVGERLVMFLNTDNRLKLPMSQTVQNIQERGAKNVLEALYLSGIQKTRKVYDKIFEMFNVKLHLDTSNLGMIQYRIINENDIISENHQEAYKQLSLKPLIDLQGDGIRSATGIITAILSVDKPIILLDEPEAFLHPPQAMQLGSIMAELVDDDQQIFIATHSSDFLKGLISTNQDINIIHINRLSSNKIKINELDLQSLQYISMDPLLSSSRVLEGMFYKGVVATEADSDTVFYQRAYQKKYASDEIHFVNAHNKQTLSKIIEPYRKLGIKFAIIADSDIIRDSSDMGKILSYCDNDGIKNQILALRTQVLNHFVKTSKKELLLKSQQELQNLLETQVGEHNDMQELEEIISKYRSELKRIRKELDILYDLKNKGKNSLSGQGKEDFDNLCEECLKIGLFIVPVGELESWLVDYGINKLSNKSKWITNALEKLFKIEYDNKKELWIFIDKIRDHFISS